MIITLSNVIRQTITKIESTHSHSQLIDLFKDLLIIINDNFPQYDYQSNEYRSIKRLIRKVEFNRHSHYQDYDQLKREIITQLVQMTS